MAPDGALHHVPGQARYDFWTISNRTAAPRRRPRTKTAVLALSVARRFSRHITIYRESFHNWKTYGFRALTIYRVRRWGRMFPESISRSDRNPFPGIDFPIAGFSIFGFSKSHPPNPPNPPDPSSAIRRARSAIRQGEPIRHRSAGRISGFCPRAHEACVRSRPPHNETNTHTHIPYIDI